MQLTRIQSPTIHKRTPKPSLARWDPRMQSRVNPEHRPVWPPENKAGNKMRALGSCLFLGCLSPPGRSASQQCLPCRRGLGWANETGQQVGGGGLLSAGRKRAACHCGREGVVRGPGLRGVPASPAPPRDPLIRGVQGGMRAPSVLIEPLFNGCDLNVATATRC